MRAKIAPDKTDRARIAFFEPRERQLTRLRRSFLPAFAGAIHAAKRANAAPGSSG